MGGGVGLCRARCRRPHEEGRWRGEERRWEGVRYCSKEVHHWHAAGQLMSVDRGIYNYV